jgi:hypothetical protein
MSFATDRRSAMTLGAAAAILPTGARSAAPDAPPLTYVFSANVLVAAPQEKGVIDGKRQRFIPITGGTVEGPRLTAAVLNGGGDWQAIHEDGLTEILARYTLQANDGTLIGVTNPGVRVASPEVIRRLSAGENVDPKLYYFRTTPIFEVARGPHDWLRRHVFVGHGIRRPNSVELRVYSVG